MYAENLVEEILLSKEKFHRHSLAQGCDGACRTLWQKQRTYLVAQVDEALGQREARLKEVATCSSSDTLRTHATSTF